VFGACSSCSCSASLSIRFGFEFWLDEVLDSVLVLSFGWTKFRTVRSRGADSPRVPSGRSVCSPRTVRFLGFATGGSVSFNGQSAAQGQTVRSTGADSPRQQARQSAWPVRTVRPSWRTVRQSLATLFLGSIPPSFFCASACASRNRS
jgi:hypothetical protein